MAGPNARAGLMAVPVNCDPAKHNYHHLCHSISLPATDDRAADASLQMYEVCASSMLTGLSLAWQLQLEQHKARYIMLTHLEAVRSELAGSTNTGCTSLTDA